ncbi:MAG: hypothetical protein AAF718_15005 [Pseudomonadota bacterium]
MSGGLVKPLIPHYILSEEDSFRWQKPSASKVLKEIRCLPYLGGSRADFSKIRHINGGLELKYNSRLFFSLVWTMSSINEMFIVFQRVQRGQMLRAL